MVRNYSSNILLLMLEFSLVRSTMTSNQEDSSGQAKSCSVGQPANDTVDVMSTLDTLSSQIALLARENERLRAENARQKTVLGQMSTTFKTLNALKTRKIKDMEDEMKRMKESSKETTIERSPHQSGKERNEESMASEESAVVVSKVESEEKGVPEDVTTLDEIKKLNKLFGTERFGIKHPFWDKISLFYGDITKINVDAIVASPDFRGSCYLAIRSAAGFKQLMRECRKHRLPVPIGQAVMTDACGLSTHVKKIIHCVGPICYGGVTDECRNQLESCYRHAIDLSEQNGLRSIAFSCISTGKSGYYNKDAVRTVIKLLYKYFSSEQNAKRWDRVVLCTYSDINKQCYKQYIAQLIRNPSLLDDDEE